MWFTPLLGGSKQQLPEIPSILRLPSVLNRQPVNTPQVNWGNPITRGLNTWQVGPHLRGATLLNVPTIVASEKGQVNNFVSGSTQALYRTMPRTGGGVNNITVVALAKISTGTIVSIGDSTSAQDFGIEMEAGAFRVRRVNTGQDDIILKSPNDSNWHVFAFTWSTSNVLTGYYDGNFASSASVAAWPGASYDLLTLGARYSNSTFAAYGTGQCALALVFNRALSASEIKSISANPWQVFQAPEKRVFTFPAREIVTRPVADVPWPSLNILSHKIKNQQQPQSAPQIDWSNPLTKGLLDWQSGNFLNGFTPVNFPTDINSSRGRAKVFSGASTQYLIKSLPTTISTLGTTIVAVARNTTTSGSRQIAGFSSASQQYYVGIEFYVNSFSWVKGRTPLATQTSSYTSLDQNWHVNIGTISSTTGLMRFYRDGIEGLTGAAETYNYSGIDRLMIGAGNWGGTILDYLTGEIALVLFFRRELTSSEIRSISENPWQVFKGHTKYIPLYSPPWKGVPDSTNLYDDIDDSRDEDYIVSPDITYGSITSPTIFTLDKFLAPGQYSIKVRARKTATYGEVRSVLLDSYDRVVGTSKWQGLTNSFSTYSLPVTTTETAYRIKVEAQREGIVLDGLALYLDAGNIQSYPGSGTTWTDLSGSGNNGILTNGPTFSSDNRGSIVFDGSNDFVSIPNFTYRFNTSFTLSIWIRFISLTTLPTTLISNYSGTATGNDGVFLEITASNAVRFVYRNLGVDVFDFYSGAVTINTTYNIVATYAASGTGGAKLYINSQQLPFTSGASNLFTPTNTTLVINRLDSAAGRYTNSNTYSAAVYNRALSAAEVAQNFNALRGRFGI